ncbi:hypothetical protein ACQ86O_21560 [Serratia sp. L9]|uniref:hypothetical protein n=1 Tax=Serratia sp. L9 TaxID=3423946 RepID=UPI003D66F09B
MKKVCFFDLQFVRHDQNAPDETHFRRILAGDKVFYTYDHQFSDANVLKKLVSGDRVFIGAHQLSDGTYWLHWLVSAEKGVLQPANNEGSYPLALLKLAGSIAVVGFSVYGYFHWMNIWLMLLFLVVFCFGGWWCMANLHAVSLSTSPRMRRLLKGFEQARNGDASFCLSQPNLMRAQWKAEPPDNDVDSLQASDFMLADRVTLSWLQGEVTHIRAKRDFSGSGKSRRDFIDYQFTCKNRRFSYQTGYNTLTEDLNPLFYRQHPFFWRQRIR